MLDLSIVLKSEVVKLTGEDGAKEYTIKELTALQRRAHNDSFNAQLSIGEDGKPQLGGSGIKIPSPIDFLALCLYDSEDKLVSTKFLEDLPDRVTSELQKKGMELSGMDAKALAAAKNELEGKPSSGTG